MSEVNKTQIAVIGMGYVGIPAACLFADAGFNVVGIQRRSKRSGWKIDLLNQGKNPIEGEEPGLAELIHRVVVEKKTFRVSDDMNLVKKMNYILIDVQTPTEKDHVPKYESLREVAHQIGKLMSKGVTVIIESTCAPGTTNYIVKPILEEESKMVAGKDFHLIFSYERVMVGRLLYNIVNLKRIVGGITPQCTEKGLWLYKHIVKEELMPTTALTAEVAKCTENTYRDVNIAFANEIALACESLGIDIAEVRKFVNSLPFTSNEKFNPGRNMHIAGAGVGGHCLPKDPWLLQYGVNMFGSYPVKLTVIQESRYLNDRMPLHAVTLLEEALTEVKKCDKRQLKIAVLGVAFLEDSDDPRNTPTSDLLAILETKNFKFVAHDPLVRQDEFEFPFSRNLDEVLTDADAIIVMTKHTIYKQLSFEKIKSLMKPSPIIIDGRDLYNYKKAQQAGFIFRGIGKPKK